ncbi:NAD(P)H-dependent oxidoreductase [Flavobacterium hungaricum]|uniref:Flavodoxin family protein n=1 Tax=Flavobacterium hungaricum TaxID=2082725 RepID=A0ABR9THJ0_9FLAO|nr:NAD(P)H-dependent oxidoreductase [Flavobacterium hungaricum]MBE8724823.1 flavodoxin family protein [Flavobacterium hungaricum]
MALLILGHPNINDSIANKAIIEEIQRKNSDIEIRNLAELYPDFKINASEEQNCLLLHEIVILQYPLYWYNMPAILKQWFDVVFTHQFAYGSKGDKLKGKKLLASVTVGSLEKEYKPFGKHNFRIAEFFKNIEQTAYFAQMNFLDPMLFHGTSAVDGFTEDEIKERAKIYANRLLIFVEKVSQS